MRPIDADSIRTEVESWDAESNNRVYQCAMEDMLRFFIEFIDKQPTIEPKVQHAYWEPNDVGEYHCTNCGVECDIDEFHKALLNQFCGQCGADMREGGAENV